MLFKNLQHYWETLACAKPLGIQKIDEATFINTGSDIPLFNPVFLSQYAQALPKPPLGATHSFWYNAERHHKLSAASIKSLEPIISPVPIMSIQLNRQFDKKPPEGFIIEALPQGHDLSLWMPPVISCFHLSIQTAQAYQHGLETAHQQFIHFFAKKESTGQIVASASLFLAQDIAGLYNLCVLDEYQKRGIGAALHHTRLREAQLRGYKLATLQATPAATHLDQSLGFEKHSDIAIFKC